MYKSKSKNILFNSLAGTGKSFELMNIAKEAKEDDYNFLYLSFNKKIRWNVIIDTGLDFNEVHTRSVSRK